MRPNVLAVLLAVGGLLSAACGQWLETTIPLTDSAGGVISPKAIAYDSVNDRVYVCGNIGNCVIVIDGATNQKLNRIAVPSGGSDLLCNPATGKLYHANFYDSTVTVINCATSQVLATVADPAHNKVYCGNYDADDISVIDCGTNQVVQTLPAGDAPGAFGLNPTWSRIYVANDRDSTVTVYRDTSPAGVTDTRFVIGDVSGGPSVIRGVLTLPASGTTTCALLDRTGRVVMSLRSGTNDVSRLAPGVYFLSERPTFVNASSAMAVVRKLIVTR